ncbi:MAG: hypothetical protein LBG49_02165 [Mycoplasmataceae bacterium]|jgi:hypothetical protein|nr:hypothetical protein [Mycoplasmataceae bacterium]
MKDNKEYEITKSNREDWIGVTFQCHIINKGVNVAPKWFRDFAAKQEEFNKAQLEFNKYVIEVFQRNNLK